MAEPTTLRDWFDEALKRAPDDRARFLATCADAELRSRVQRMLAIDDSDEELPDAAVIASRIGGANALHDLPPGSRVGPFELHQVIGEGGSSTVFRAVRGQGDVRQPVALKLLRHGLYTPEAQRQFRRERLALAQLRHPGIAHLIEGGLTESGLAYIALELVDGLPITEHARANRLDLRTRLRLFLKVCHAVDAAHRALIVHRDLKPSNVLVTAEGEVKLLDFGIAKLLGGDDQTQTRLPSFTPAYAAPEQKSGAAVTTATDVYALGMLLGELMTGTRLANGRTPSAQVGDRVEDGVLPAAATTTRRLLRGDIDNIVLKALDEEPAQRYASASAFADDIERLLEGRPVAAHPPSRWYRVSKFVARHKGGVATSAAFLLAVFAALGLALWNGHRATVNAQQASLHAQRAEAVQAFLVDLFHANAANQPDPVAARQTTARQLLDLGAQRIGEAMDTAPPVKLELLETLASLHDDLGLYARSAELRAHAAKLAAVVFGADAPQNADALANLATSLLGANRFDEAAATLKQAEAVLDRHAGDASLPRAKLFLKLSTLHQDTDVPRAIGFAKRAADAFVRIGERGGLAEALGNLGWLLDSHGQHEQATNVLQRAIAIRRELPGADQDLPRLHAYLADAQLRCMQLPQAEANARQALADVLKLNGDEPADTAYFQMRVGRLLAQTGRPREALDLLARAIFVAGRVDEYQSMWAHSMHAQALVGTGATEQGARELEQAIATCLRLQPGAGFLAGWFDALTTAHSRLGDFAAAEKTLAQAAAIHAQHGHGADTADMTHHRATAAELLLARGKAAEARAELDRGGTSGTTFSFATLRADLAKARAAFESGDSTTALAVAQQLHDRIEHAGLSGYLKPQLAEIAMIRGRVALERGDAATAVAQMSQALAWRKASFLPEAALIAETEQQLQRARTDGR